MIIFAKIDVPEGTKCTDCSFIDKDFTKCKVFNAKIKHHNKCLKCLNNDQVSLFSLYRFTGKSKLNLDSGVWQTIGVFNLMDNEGPNWVLKRVYSSSLEHPIDVRVTIPEFIINMFGTKIIEGVL